MSDEDEELTDEQVNRIVANVTKARAAILAHLNNYPGRKGNQIGGIVCPVCEVGALDYIRYSHNGHITAKCNTPDCVQWIE